MTRPRGSTALPATLVALVVSVALTAAMADLARTELAVGRQRRTAAVALATADRCLAETLATLPIGWDFDGVLAGPDGTGGTADDGRVALATPCTSVATAAPGAALPPRVRVTVTADTGEGRRALEAVVGRAPAPGVPALVWLADPTVLGVVGGLLTLDGRLPGDPPGSRWAGLAAPIDPAALDGWIAAQGGRVIVTADSPIVAGAPPLAALTARVRAAGASGALAAAGPVAPALIHAAGDLVVGTPQVGAGLLLVEGTLDIRSTLEFNGVIVAVGGMRVAAGAALGMSGALWLGGPVLDVAGAVVAGRDDAAVAAADALLGLPRRPALLGLHDLG
jgi:hypothetical protein